MASPVNRRPFTSRIESLRRKGMRYADLEAECDRARSTAWFNNLVNHGPGWVGPPARSDLSNFASLMDTTTEHVAEMIAAEWYGVRVAEVSPRVLALSQRLDALSGDDAGLVETLVQRLLPPSVEAHGESPGQSGLETGHELAIVSEAAN